MTKAPISRQNANEPTRFPRICQPFKHLAYGPTSHPERAGALARDQSQEYR